jgi:hypothetical protein
MAEARNARLYVMKDEVRDGGNEDIFEQDTEK